MNRSTSCLLAPLALLLATSCTNPQPRPKPPANPTPTVRAEAKPVKVEFRLVVPEATVGASEYLNAQNRQPTFVDPEILLSNDDIANAATGRTPQGESMIQILFTREGAAKLARVTEQNINRNLAILVDDQMILAPRIVEPIKSGSVTLVGALTDAGAKRIVRGLKP